MDALTFMPALINKSDWQKLINGKMKKAQITKVSSDGSVSGQFMAHLQEFCTEMAQAKKKDEILLRRPWTQDDPEEKDYNITYFRLKDLFDHLIRNRFTHFNHPGQIIAEFQNIEGFDMKKAQRFFKLKGKGVNVWGIPAFPKQDSPFDTEDKNGSPF